MPNLTSRSQSSFVQITKMLNGVLVINELVDLKKRHGRKRMFLNIDFEKVYDIVSYDCLRSIMRLMGFGAIWLGWVKACEFFSSLSILVNGSPTNHFQAHRGLT